MDLSTENVTLYAVFITDVLKEFDAQDTKNQGLFEMVEDYELDDPYIPVPIELYNNMCDWVYKYHGKEKLLDVGKNVGQTAYGSLIENHIIQADASPTEIIEGLAIAAGSLIQDEKNRGWEILASTDHSISLRRTQTFNRTLQFGLLKSIIAQSDVKHIAIRYTAEVTAGGEFDEYEITWE